MDLPVDDRPTINRRSLQQRRRISRVLPEFILLLLEVTRLLLVAQKGLEDVEMKVMASLETEPQAGREDAQSSKRSLKGA